MREEGEHNNAFEMAVCIVTSIDPVAIVYNNVPIDHNIYCNEGWIYPEVRWTGYWKGKNIFRKV